MVEPEAPVRRDAGCGELRMVGVGQRQRAAFIDRRQAAPEQHLATQIEFFRCLVAAIDAADLFERLEMRLVQVEALGLARLAVGRQAEPGKIVADRGDECLVRARLVGIVEPQDEAPAMFARIKPVVQRGADIADMEIAGRRRREAGDDVGVWGHGCAG